MPYSPANLFFFFSLIYKKTSNFLRPRAAVFSIEDENSKHFPDTQSMKSEGYMLRTRITREKGMRRKWEGRRGGGVQGNK
jgi:hypothetical protein